MNDLAETFRLLDGRVGWDPQPDGGLAGLAVDAGTLRLGPLRPAGQTAGAALATRLARSGDGSWWLGTPSGICVLGPCDEAFRCWRRTPAAVAGLAVRGRMLAAVLGSGAVLVLDIPAAYLAGQAAVPGAVSARFAADRLMVAGRRGRLTWLDFSGLRRPGPPGTGVPPPVPLPPGVTVYRDGFLIEGRGAFDMSGRNLDESSLGPPPATVRRRGQYLSLPLDSGRAGCRWHRIRLDASVPPGTDLDVAFATTDGPAAGRTPPPVPPGPWSSWPPGDPDPADWFTIGSGVTDSTLQVAPGRYGYLRIRMTGDGTASPAVRQVRLDLPRRTSLGLLPAVYSQDPLARDFTERFLSLFDAHLEELDDVLDRRGALLDADALPDAALGWLGGLIGIGFEVSMPAERRRALLRAAPDLYRRRGTPGGLADTLRIALGVSAGIEELGTSRPWGALGSARLGSVRLFGRSRVRVRLGSSRLGRAVLNSSPRPDDDAVLAGASRIRVHTGPGTDRALVERVVRSQSPAHVVATVHVATPGFAAGLMRAGIDTVLVPPEPAVLGRAVLGRRGVLRRGRSPAAARVAGASIVVGAGEPANTSGTE